MERRAQTAETLGGEEEEEEEEEKQGRTGRRTCAPAAQRPQRPPPARRLLHFGGKPLEDEIGHIRVKRVCMIGGMSRLVQQTIMVSPMCLDSSEYVGDVVGTPQQFHSIKSKKIQ